MATVKEYRPPVKEFFLTQSKILPDGSVKHSTAGPTILIVLEGNGSIIHEESNQKISEGVSNNFVFVSIVLIGVGNTFFFQPHTSFEVKNTGLSNLLIYEAVYQI